LNDEELVVLRGGRDLLFGVILLAQIEEDGVRLPYGEIVVLVIDKSRDAAVGVDLEERGLLVLGIRLEFQIDRLIL